MLHMRKCWLAEFSDKPCDGPLDPAHLIPKQRIKRDVSRDPRIVWHHSVWRWSCRFHHGSFDSRFLRVPRSAVPEETEAFAREFGIVSSLDRDFDDT